MKGRDFATVPAVKSLLLRLFFALCPLASLCAQAPGSEVFLPDPVPPEARVVRPVLLDLIPTLSVKDLSKAADFYTGKLGFYIVLQSGNTYTAVGRDTVQIGLALDKTKPKDRKGSLYIQTRSIDVLYEELTKRGVKMTSELKTQPSKMREFSVTDPEGNLLIFGEYVGGN